MVPKEVDMVLLHLNRKEKNFTGHQGNPPPLQKRKKVDPL